MSDVEKLNIRFLKAEYGDSILISFYQSGEKQNILIDGGPSAAYSGRDKQKGQLKEVLDGLSENEKIDLLIVTHVDNDHIRGVLKWLEKEKDVYKKIREVWFNSEDHISSYFKQTPTPDRKTQISNDYNLGYREGKTFEEYLNDHSNCITWDKKVIKAGQQLEKFDGAIQFSILSPNLEKLRLLLDEWGCPASEPEQEPKADFNLTGKNDFGRTLMEHLKNDKFKEDDAPHNGSSIAFIMTFENKNFLFLADSHPSVIVQSLREYYGFSKNKPIEAALVKLSHHGSKYNNSKELLEMIKSPNFVVSTNGLGSQKHPHKQLMARLISIHSKCRILFNYPELIDAIFQKNDYRDFPGFEAKPIDELNI